jgi:pyruvate dehydrogenase E1 component
VTAQGKDGKSEGERVRIPIIREGLAAHLPDIDPDETTEWLESFDAVVDAAGQ